jgi:hypothetical protein
MAITQAMCTLFKKDVMLGDQHLDSDTLHIALYTSSATLDATTDGYITANEVASGGGIYHWWQCLGKYDSRRKQHQRCV